MNITLQAPPLSAGTPDLPVPVRRRRPLLRAAWAAQPASMQPVVRSPTSLWPTCADARAHEVLQAYRLTGGLTSGDTLVLQLRRRTSQPISMLARWIVERRVVSFGWEGQCLLPMFQFENAELEVRRPVAAVLAELAGTFDDWDLATWFALPNSWLADAAPVHVLGSDPGAVLQAARADRFIACG